MQQCKAIDFPVGAYYVDSEEKLEITGKRILNNDVFQGVVLYTKQPRSNGKSYLYFFNDSVVRFELKSN